MFSPSLDSMAVAASKLTAAVIAARVHNKRVDADEVAMVLQVYDLVYQGLERKAEMSRK